MRADSLFRESPQASGARSMEPRPIRFFHRGAVVEIADAAPTRTVLEWLREDPRAAPAAITLFGQPIGHHSPRKRRKEGLHFVPEERLGRGRASAE